jgi:6-phospho-beta-glucosidase
MKLTVLGGGGVRSMFLAKSIVTQARTLSITNIVFMDNDEKKLNIFGKMSKHISEMIDNSIQFELTTDPIYAIRDADYIITTIRVGGDDMRISDERFAIANGLIGQETTGAAGFSFAMRSIPQLLDYCQIAKEIAKKNVKIFNFTNPAGVVSQALNNAGFDFSFGICDAPSGMLHEIAYMLDMDSNEISGECFGLNHLSYITNVNANGKDITRSLLENDKLYEETEMRLFPKKLAMQTNALMNEYLYYFYFREQAEQNIGTSVTTRGERIKDINRSMFAELETVNIDQNFEQALKIFEKWYGLREDNYMENETGKKRTKKPFSFDPFSRDEGGYAAIALKYIRSLQTKEDTTMILCVPNKGKAIPFLEETDVVEITCDITGNGWTAHKLDKLMPIPTEIIRRVKAYERLAANAIIQKDRMMAIEALFVHPLINSYSLAEKLVDEYISHNSEFSGGWH